VASGLIKRSLITAKFVAHVDYCICLVTNII